MVPAFKHSTSRPSCLQIKLSCFAAFRTLAKESKSHSTPRISVDVEPHSFEKAMTSAKAGAFLGDARFNSTTRFAPRRTACFASQIPNPFAVAPVTATVFPDAASPGIKSKKNFS